MATQTLRPNATVSNDYSIVPSGTADSVVDDEPLNDTTYILSPFLGATAVFGLTTYTVPAGSRVHRIRARVRGQASSGTAYVGASVSAPGLSGTLLNDSYTSSGAVTRTGPWGTLSAPLDQADVDDIEVTVTDVTSTGGLKITEIYVDLDVWEATDAPTVSAPTGTITDTDKPDITWTVANVNDGVPASYSRQIRVFRDAVYLAGGFDPETETDVEWEVLQTGQAATGGTVAPTTPLANSDTYRAYVRVGKEGVAGETLWSSWSNSEFTLNLTLPDEPTSVTVSTDTDLARARVTVNFAVGPGGGAGWDEFWVYLERSSDGGTTWESVRGGQKYDGKTGSSPLVVDDYELPRGVVVRYRAYTIGMPSTSSSLLQSGGYTLSTTFILTNDSKWHLKDPLYPDLNMVLELEGASLDQERPVDVAHFAPLGREYFVAVTDKVRQPRFQLLIGTITEDEFEDLEALYETGRTLLFQHAESSRQYYVSIDSPIMISLLNTNDPWRKNTLKLVSVEPPVVEDL